MLSALLNLLGTVFGWLGGLLPDSPLSGFAVVTEDMRMGIAWLNWLVPMGEMLTALGLWIAAVALFTVIKQAFAITAGIGGKVAGQ